jgi:hypothetical protein
VAGLLLTLSNYKTSINFRKFESLRKEAKSMYRMYEPREAGRQMAHTASYRQCQAVAFTNYRSNSLLLNPLIIALIISLINLLLVLSPLGL